jgi:hypothetical protein
MRRQMISFPQCCSHLHDAAVPFGGWNPVERDACICDVPSRIARVFGATICKKEREKILGGREAVEKKMRLCRGLDVQT